MEPITLKINDVQVTLRAVYRNKEYPCDCKDRSIRCGLREQLSDSLSTEVFVATETVFNVRNTSSESWPVQVRNWELVDTDGYAYKARALCDSLRPPRTLEPSISLRAADGSHVTQGTQVDFVLVFPALENDKEIACILYSEGELAFELKEMRPEAMDLMQAREAARAGEAARESAPSREQGLGRFRLHIMKRLEPDIHSRLNNTLTPNQAIVLENKIQKVIFEIRQELEFTDEHKKKVVEEKLEKIIPPYESKLAELRKQEEKIKKLDDTIEQLSKFSGRQFEEWFADLLREIGYEKVTLTPSSNDEGIDILAEYKDSKVAVQCKHWKEKVGQPEVRDFLRSDASR